MKEVKKVVQAARHRPLHPERAAHRRFVETQLEKVAELEGQYDFLDFGEERKMLRGE